MLFSIFSIKESEFKTLKYKNPLFFFLHFWQQYEKFKVEYIEKNKKPPNNQFSGAALGIILTYLFDREGILIDKMDEKINGVPFVKPDFIIKSKSKNLFFISIKVSGRERWKQADWEAIKYKKKYPNASCILLMNHKVELENLKKNLPQLDLDGAYYAGSDDINEMIRLIKS